MMTANKFLETLDSRIAKIVSEINASEVMRAMSDKQSSAALVRAIVRNMLLDVHCYGPSITEATATAIGRLSDWHSLIPPLMRQLLEEVSHPNLAFRGYIALGGEHVTHRSSPAAFAVGAVVKAIANGPAPIAYLGYMYLLEGTTAIVAEQVRQVMEERDLAVEFVSLHAKEDAGHAAGVRMLIQQVVEEHPEAAAEIEYGFECFASVYPHPVWALALQRAQHEVSSGR